MILGAMGLSQSFSDQYASCMRGQYGPTFGYGLGFQTLIFLFIVASIQVRQSAAPLQIVCGKTLTGPSATVFDYPRRHGHHDCPAGSFCLAQALSPPLCL